jgi:fructose-specific component phosphotransferase system IIB-like protein
MAYHHVNTTNDVDQVIIIGDAPSNNDAHTDKKRESKG